MRTSGISFRAHLDGKRIWKEKVGRHEGPGGHPEDGNALFAAVSARPDEGSPPCSARGPRIGKDTGASAGDSRLKNWKEEEER
jgi:hypothetical protein